MKRQGTSSRRLSSESEQVQTHESKRLKVRHNPQTSYNVEDTGSGSSTEEDFNFGNGQTSTLKSLAKEGSSMQSFSENGGQYDSDLNGSVKHISNSNSEEVPMHNQVNGSRPDGTENNLQHDVSFQQQHANGFENDSDENNSKNTSADNLPNILPNNIIEDSSSGAYHQENLLAEAEYGKVNNTDYPAPPILQPEVQHEQMEYSSVIVSDFNQEEKIPESASIPASATEKSSDEHSTIAENVSSLSPDQQEASSSLKESSSQKLGPESASLMQPHVDVDHITLCELNVTELVGHADVVFCVAADKDFILSSSGDTTVKVWNVEEKAEICNFAGHHAAVSAVALLSPEQSEILRSKLNCFQTSRIAVSASYDCHIRLWSVLEGHEILSMYTFNSITCMGYLEELMYVVVGTEGGKLEVWDLHLAKLVHSVYAHDSSVSSLEIHGCYIYSASKDGAVKVWLFEEGELQPLYTRRRKETNTNTSTFGPTQWKAVTVHRDMLFLGDNTSCLKALDWRIGRLRLFLNQQDNNGICEAVLAKHNILLTTFYDTKADTGGINVWKLPDVAYVGTLTGDLQEICSLAITQSENLLRIVSGGHQLLVWDFDFSKPPIKTPQDPFFVCEVDKIGSEVDEKSIDSIASKRTHLEPATAASEKKKSWCNIS